MLLNRYSPLHLLDEMQDTFRLLDEFAGGTRRGFTPAAYPALNAWADEHNFYVEAELPGMKLDDVETFVDDRQILTIKGKRSECACDHGNWLARERGYGAFERQVQLPGPVDDAQAEASFVNGVLTIKLPKAPEIRPRKIEVKTK
jgi:HSP20 family protein